MTAFVMGRDADWAAAFDDLDLVSGTGRAATGADVTAYTDTSARPHRVSYHRHYKLEALGQCIPPPRAGDVMT